MHMCRNLHAYEMDRCMHKKKYVSYLCAYRHNLFYRVQWLARQIGNCFVELTHNLYCAQLL